MQHTHPSKWLHLALLISLIASSTNAISDSPAKALKQRPPAALLPYGVTLSARDTFGYDFNRDGVTDWVMIARGGGSQGLDNLIVQLSQANKTFKKIQTTQFDPDRELQSYNFDWKINIKLTAKGELHVQNNNTDPMSSSDAMSSYRFKFVGNNFVLTTYTHGYTGHEWGNYRRAFIYDLTRNTLQESDKERCDEQPELPCKTGKTYKLKPGIPKITLENFSEARDIKAIGAHRPKTAGN